MSRWILAIDFGTSFTAASTRERGRDPELVEMDAPFGPQVRMPSLVLAHEGGELMVGWAAETQAQVTPERVERTPKRRLGEAEPLLLGSRAIAPEDACAAVLRAVLDEARRREGRTEPAEVRLTHPARWARRRLDALREAALRAGIRRPLLLSEPAAAAVHFSGRLATDDLVAVYDLGGGTFDTAVLRRTDAGEFEQVGPPGGKDGLGGETFDERLTAFLENELRAASSADGDRLRNDRRVRAQFRHNVRAAKEALSQASAVDVPLPAGLQRQSIRVTRDDFERLIRLDVEETVQILARTLADAGVRPEELRGIFLAGGSTRIPLVPRLVEERLGRFDTYDEPKAVVALGAARWETGPVERESSAPGDQRRQPARIPPAGRQPPSRPPRARPRLRRPGLLAAGGAAAALVLVLAAFAFTRDGSDGPPTDTETNEAFPSGEEEQELSRRLPPSAENCVRESNERALATAACALVGTGLVGVYSLYGGTDPMNAGFEDELRGGEPVSSGGCPPEEGEEWPDAESPLGRWACFERENAAHVAWTNDSASVLAVVSHAVEGVINFDPLVEYFHSVERMLQ
jgi:molecular chaperone DnaK